MTAPKFPALLCALALSSLTAAPAAEPITTASLLAEMTDLAALTRFPDPAYTCKQFSSYDRKAVAPGQDWFANADCGHYLRVEEIDGRKEHVMMDTSGPGAVVRIWSANPAGTLRVYLDGAAIPVLEAPMTDLLGGKFPGLPAPLAGERSKGWNLYFPIPYAKHCKITSDQGKFYYHVNYRTWPAGTPVASFRREDLTTLAAAVEQTRATLASPPAVTGDARPIDLKLPPGGKTSEIFPGPAAIAGITAKLDTANPEAALRGIVVRIRFDDEECVVAPLGDLFGSAPGLNPFSTLPLAITKDGHLTCRWHMPFAKSAVIELHNQGTAAARLTGEIVLRQHSWSPRDMHFHAKWRAQAGVPTRPMIDWNYLTAHGRGVFVGASFAIDNPVKKWWGEGDEKIHVDGEPFPSHFGTGTEDYYGYAWCSPALFTHAYHSQSRCDGPGNHGRTSVNRFHILDRIPFQHDFRFDMELWHWHESCEVNMAVTAYWYAAPGGTDAFPPVRAEDLVVHPLPQSQEPRVPGAIEGEELKIVRVTGTAEPQDWDGLSNGRQLWWHQGMKPGDRLTLAFPAPKAGQYRVFARFLQAKDYGIHQLAVNGAKAGEPVDFYQPKVVPAKETDLGVFDLKQGDNEFTVTVTGSNPKAEPRHMFGLDYLRLQTVP